MKFSIHTFCLLIVLIISNSCEVKNLQNQTPGDQIVDSIFEDGNEDGIPDQPITIRINYILLQNDDGEGGFDETNEEHMDILNSMLSWTNGSLTSNAAIKNPDCYDKEINCSPERKGSNYHNISDTKLRFELGEVITVNDTKYWDHKDCQDSKSDENCPGDGLKYRCPNHEYTGNWYLNPLSQEINEDPYIKPGINIFFSEDAEEFEPYVIEKTCDDPVGRFHTQNCSEGPVSSLDKPLRMNMRSTFLKFNYLVNCKVCPTPDGKSDDCYTRDKIRFNFIDGESRTLMHELGHSVEFTALHCNLCPGEGLMHTSNSGRKLHPIEIKNAHEKIRTTNLTRYVVSESPIFIAKDRVESQEWNHFLNLHRDYVIKDNKYLWIKNETNLLKGKKIIVYDGELIVYDAGELIMAEGSTIIIKDGGKFILKSGATLNMLDNGKLIIEDGGEFEVSEGASLLKSEDNEIIYGKSRKK